MSNLVSLADSRERAAPARARAMVFADPGSQRLLEQAGVLARSDVSVLVSGESGTGKELVARHIHAESGRKGPFIAVNCGALTPSLAEAELFGHEHGAYTGAAGARAGWFETAHGGTLLLDEIADLPLGLQVKILRVLQEREVVRVGARKPIPIDVRLIAATNVNLSEAVAAGRFRLDLFFRLHVAALTLLPLRERPGDVIPLAEHFLALCSERMQIPTPVLLPETQRALLWHAWPGNIRELENVIHFAALVCTDNVIRPENLRFTAMPSTRGIGSEARESTASGGSEALDALLASIDRLFRDPPENLLPRLEELVVRRAFTFCGGNQVHSARLLGISRNVLRTLLKRFALIAPDASSPADSRGPALQD